ncbi:MAG: secretin N-terminal domain-containing protein [bacterium]
MRQFRPSRLPLLLVVISVLMTLAVHVPAQQQQEEITIPLDGAKVIRTNSPVSRVITGQSGLVRIKVLNSREIAVFGLKTGATTLHLWTERGLRQNLLVVEEVGSLTMGDQFRSAFTASRNIEGDTGDMQLKVFTPEYRKVSEFESYIKELLKDDGRIILSDPPSGKIFVVGKSAILQKIQDLIDRLDVPGEDKVFSKRIVLENRPVTQIQEQISSMLSGEGKIIVDRETNSILIVDKVSKVNSVQDYLDKIDQPTIKQVRIKTRFVEMSEEAQQELGINWSEVGSANGNIIEANYNGSSGLRLLVNNPASSLAQDLTATLNALESDGLLNLISSPSVITRNQQQAQLEIINKQSYLSGCNVDNAGNGAQSVTPAVSEVQDGVTLSVTPLIGKNDIIQLKISPQLKLFSFDSSLSASSPCGTIRFPTVETRDANLNVALKDGQTLVIGGLSRRQETDNSSRIPILGDIPLFGFLFKNQASSVDDQEITIFVTAKIVNFREQASPANKQASDTNAIEKTIQSPDI